MGRKFAKRMICEVCKKPYEYYQKVSYRKVNGRYERLCEHDEQRTGTIGFWGENIDSEWTRRIKQERQHYEADILQPVKHNGEVNKHFRKMYGDKTIRKEYKKNEEVIKQLKRSI